MLRIEGTMLSARFAPRRATAASAAASVSGAHGSVNASSRTSSALIAQSWMLRSSNGGMPGNCSVIAFVSGGGAGNFIHRTYDSPAAMLSYQRLDHPVRSDAMYSFFSSLSTLYFFPRSAEH